MFGRKRLREALDSAVRLLAAENVACERARAERDAARRITLRQAERIRSYDAAAMEVVQTWAAVKMHPADVSDETVRERHDAAMAKLRLIYDAPTVFGQVVPK